MDLYEAWRMLKNDKWWLTQNIEKETALRQGYYSL